MTDEQPPDSASRRARLATRRQRLRILGVALAVVIVIAGVTTAVELRESDADTPTPSVAKKASAKLADDSTTINLGEARGLKPPRTLSHDKPLKLWVGGDSLAGSFGPALGDTASATGVVDTTIDYKVSSGLEDQGIRDWEEHAQEKMTADDPDAVVFIIGTNDASIANTYDSDNDGKPDYEAAYREKIDRMMTILVGGARHRTVLWLGPPTLGSDNMDKGAKLLGEVMRQEAKKYSPDVVYVDTYHLFSDADGEYSRELPDADGEETQMRISDGIHFTVDGATYLADNVWKLLNKRWHIAAEADPSQPIDYTIAEGSNDYVPGVGRYRPSNGSSSSGGSSSGSSDGSSSGSSDGSSGETSTTTASQTGTTIASHTPTTVVTATTTPHVTTPTTQPHTTTPSTTPHTAPPPPSTQPHTPAT